jgi:HPt (histidine-containing phosphotransfer) domain-containing protein
MQSLPLPLRFDPGRLRRLLDLVGPTEARTFLTQLDRDLSDCSRQIAVATEQQDWTALREASHVLISLAGSVGALALQSLAEALNAAAHARNAAALPNLYNQIAPDLTRLIAVVRATPDPFASPR